MEISEIEWYEYSDDFDDWLMRAGFTVKRSPLQKVPTKFSVVAIKMRNRLDLHDRKWIISPDHILYGIWEDRYAVYRNKARRIILEELEALQHALINGKLTTGGRPHCPSCGAVIRSIYWRCRKCRIEFSKEIRKQIFKELRP